MKNIKRVGSHKERMQLIEDKTPCIILATSGMLVGGPSVEYLKYLCEDKKHSMIFSCYQAEGSLGKKIREGAKEFSVAKGNKVDTYKINMEVSKFEISGHADRRELMNFISKCNPRPKRILFNHGEQSRLLDFANSVHRAFRVETTVPRNLDSIRLR